MAAPADRRDRDAGLEKSFGIILRPAANAVAKAGLELIGEDVTGPDLGRHVALIIWISFEKFNEKLHTNLRPWFAGKFFLGMVATALKALTPSNDLKAFWARAIGKPVDTVWDGIVDGVRIRASDNLEAWGKKMSDAERMALMTPEAYARAEAFVNKIPFIGDAVSKPATDKKGATSATDFGSEPDYDNWLRELFESGDDAKRATVAELEPLWLQFGRELPKHAQLVSRASLLGFLPIDQINRALRTTRVGFDQDDPEKRGKKISRQHFALKALAGFAKQRLDARPLLMIDPEKEKEEEGSPVFTPGRMVAIERELALEAYLNRGSSMERRLRPFKAVPLPFIGTWKRALATVIALLILFIVASIVRGFVGNDPGATPPANVQPANRQRVDGGVTPRRDASTDAGTHNVNRNPNHNYDASSGG